VDDKNIFKYKTFYDPNSIGFAKVTFSKDSFLFKERYYKKMILLDFDKYELLQDYFFREENGKVYHWQDDNEKLLYDFCLNVGDSFNNDWKVIHKGNLTTDQGATQRQVLTLQNTSGSIQRWIEGIGDNLKFSTFNMALCEFYSTDQNQIYYNALAECSSPVNNKFVDYENAWHLTVPQWIEPGYSYWLSLTKDSFLVDGKYYHKQIQKIDGNTDWEVSDYYFRENLGRVFTKYKNRPEILAYNFAAAVGDTFYVDEHSSSSYHVTNIENITTLDGISRRKLTLKKCNHEEVYWIEGVGETRKLYGLELGCIIFDPGSQFNCMMTRGELVFSRSACTSSVETESLPTQITINPNPTVDYLTIVSENHLPRSIQITDLLGKTHITKDIESHETQTIDVNTLMPGIYLCHIFIKEEKPITLKFVKQN
jgi:hypothetical protein